MVSYDPPLCKRTLIFKTLKAKILKNYVNFPSRVQHRYTFFFTYGIKKIRDTFIKFKLYTVQSTSSIQIIKQDTKIIMQDKILKLYGTYIQIIT